MRPPHGCAGRSYARPLDAVDWVRVRADGAGWRVTAGKVVSRSDPYQPGHFPELTLYPAAFLIETVRQAVGLAGVQGAELPAGPEATGSRPLRESALGERQGEWLEIESLRQLRLLQPMLDGDELVLSIDAVPDGAALRLRAGAARQDGTPVAELAARLVRGGLDADNTPPARLHRAPPPGDSPPARLRHAPPPPGDAPSLPCDYARILALLPVRHPILLVDRVVSLTPGERLETVKAVSGSEPCYAGLAEELPAARYAYPRSLLVESLGQSSALLWLGSEQDPGERAGWVPVAARLRDCRFFGDAFPGDVVRHTVRLHTVIDGRAAFMSGQSRVGDRVLCEVGALTAVRRPRAALLGGRER